MSKIATKGWRYSRCGPIASVLKLDSFDIPVAKDDVVVKIRYAPLHRVDSAIVNGSALGRKINGTLKGFPRIGGSEGVGTVVRSGSAKNLKEGDTVWIAPINGTWSETTVCDANLVHKIDPKHALLAATASNFIVARQLLAQSGASGSVVIQNGGSSLTALAVAALAQESKTTVLTAATQSERFVSAESRLKLYGSSLFPYSSAGSAAMRKAIGSRDARLFLNGVGGRSFNDFVKLLGDDANVCSFGAQNSYGLMWAGSNQIYKQITMRGFFLPRHLKATPYEERQANLDLVLDALAAKNLKYPTEESKGLEGLPTVWDKLFVRGGAKGMLVL